MKSIWLVAGVFIAFCAGLFLGMQQHSWQGVDETVVEAYAAKAGRTPLPSVINTDKGDLFLFLFLTAGALGGFLGGYCFRGMFPSKAAKKE